jgi:hypothetical protein
MSYDQRDLEGLPLSVKSRFSSKGLDMKTNNEGIYRVILEDVVTLTITIGDAQLGYSFVSVNGKEVARGAIINKFPLGKGKDLLWKTLSINTEVTVVNPNTNHTSVTYTLEGGKELVIITDQKTAEKFGDTVDYLRTFAFKE